MTGGSGPIGLLVIHGIGEQKPGETLEHFLDGIRLGFPKAQINQDFIKASIHRLGREIKVYEVHWAKILSGKRVRSSFKIKAIQEFLWFPYFNRKAIDAYKDLYPRWLVALWTAFLLPFAAMLTATYFSLSFLESIYFGIQQRRKGYKGINQKDKPVSYFLDNHIADVFNYVESAGKADGQVASAVDEIYDKFHTTLRRAVIEDGCKEIQILAHSLGTVIAYHALTRFKEKTAQLIQLDDKEWGKPQFTRLYTTGSPLEKVRFFWPKIAADPLKIVKGQFNWDNFANPKDRIGGLLKRYGGLTNVRNYKVSGVGGLITSHSGYRNNPLFLSVLAEGLTGQPTKAQIPKSTNFEWRRLLGWTESVLVPIAFLGLSILGFWIMLGIGWVSGFIIGIVPFLIGEGVRLLFDTDWKIHSDLLSLLEQIFAWMIPSLLIVVAMILGCRKGNMRHKKYWRNAEGLEQVAAAISSSSGIEKQNHIKKVSDIQPIKTKIILKFLGGLPMREKLVEIVENESPYRNPKSFAHFVVNVSYLIAIVAVGLWWRPELPEIAWLLIMLLMAAFMVTFGHGITGSWRGVLIDGRYRISVGRLQLLAWTLLILSAIIAAAFNNVRLGLGSPLEIDIPSQLWVLMGITTASAVSGPAVLANKQNLQPDDDELKKTEKILNRQLYEPTETRSVVLKNRDFKDARWGDLLKGDESGNAAAVDLGKIQMFFFTFVLIVTYGAAIANILAAGEPITALPPVDEGMNVLLGISHTGYVANKAVSHSREADDKKDKEGNLAVRSNR